MRISDWSSDVCSSDLERDIRELLAGNAGGDLPPQARGFQHVGLVDRDHVAAALAREPAGTAHDALDLRHAVRAQVARAVGVALLVEIGRASCRERVFQYV